MSDTLYVPVSEKIRRRLIEAGASYFANDNISDYIAAGELAKLQEEIASNVGQSEALLAKLRLEIEEVANKRNAALDAYRADKQAAADEAAAAKKQTQVVVAQLAAKVTQAQADTDAKLTALAAEVNASQLEASRAYADAVAIKQAELDALDAKLSTAQKALDKIKAKLG
jgi:hypothetical protein